MGGGDAFSTRVTFTNLLKELSARHASNQAVGKVGNYAHKHRDQAEVLYACILEAMQEDKNPLTCMNIFWVLDYICRSGEKVEAQKVYRHHMQPDLQRIVDCIVPPEGGGRVNIPNARKTLKGWLTKALFPQRDLQELLNTLDHREANQLESYTKAEITKRIEEDRDRHKRNKEDIWCRVNLALHPSLVEFNEKWPLEEAELTPLEWDTINEENEKYLRASCCDTSITPWVLP